MEFRQNNKKKLRNKPVKAQARSNAASRGVVASKDVSRTLIKVVAGVMLAIWILLWLKVMNLQVISGPEYAAAAWKQYLATEKVRGKRGTIYDRNGNVLACSIDSYSLSAQGKQIENLDEASEKLSKILNIPKQKLINSLQDKNGFVWVARKIADKEASDIADAKLKGFSLHRESERIYPYKQIAGQLLGFVGMDDKGLEGIEASFDERLAGTEVDVLVQRDGRGGRLTLQDGDANEQIDGRDVHLTLDLQVQFFAEAAIADAVETHKAKWGGCIVIDVKTGDVLAWAQYPFFNPNAYKNYSAFEQRNKLTMDALEHGSTIKPFAVGAALQEGIVTPDTEFDCLDGRWTVHGHTIRDASRASRGMQTVAKILRYSSNIGMGKIAQQMGSAAYGKYLLELGFGQRVGLPLPGENSGILRNPNKWPEMDLISAAFGQGFSATTAQVSQAYLTLANGGVRKPLQLVMEDDLRSVDYQERVYTPEVNSELLAMLKDVVMTQDGGGRGAQIPGTVIAGKTGTAQKAHNGTYGDARVASFVGMMPADKPEYLIHIVLDDLVKNQYGATVAIPVFRKVLVQTLAYNGILPDPSDPDLATLDSANNLQGNPAIYEPMKIRQDKEQLIVESEKEDAILQEALDQANGDANPGMVQRNSAKPSEQVARVNNAAPKSAKPSVSSVAIPQAAIGKIPEVVGLNKRSAVELFQREGIVPRLRGRGATVIKQTPPAGNKLIRDGSVEYILWLEESAL